MVESKRPVDVFVDVLIHVVIVIACFLGLLGNRFLLAEAVHAGGV